MSQLRYYVDLPEPPRWRYAAIRSDVLEQLKAELREDASAKPFEPFTGNMFAGLRVEPKYDQARPAWLFSDEKLWLAYLRGDITEERLEYLASFGMPILSPLDLPGRLTPPAS